MPVTNSQDATLPSDLALVINLEAAADRRAFQTGQLSRLAIPYRILSATSVADVPPAEMERLRRRWARPLRATEVACTLSHRRAWAEVVASGRPRLILEDDVILSRDMPRLLAELLHRTDLDYVTFETFVLPKLLSRQTSALGAAPFRLARLFRDRGGAAAYLLWPAGAAKVLKATEHVLPLADAAIDLTPGLRAQQVEPAAAVQALCLGLAAEPYGTVRQSIIGTEAMPDYGGPASRFRFRWRRLKLEIRLLIRRLAAHGAEVRQVSPAADIVDGQTGD